MKVGSLFSGIGGFDLGLERAGMEITFQVECDDYCRQVLQKHWPAVPCHYDIRSIDWEFIKPVDLICGGFPCQPFSVAGKRRGKADDRYLWPQVVRCLDTLRPTWFLGENVPGLLHLGIEQVLADLEAIGYQTAVFGIPACAVDAPHIRQRLWILSHSSEMQRQTIKRSESNGIVSGDEQVSSDSNHGRCSRRTRKQRAGWWGESENGNRWPDPPALCRVDARIPRRVDRVEALGNSVVPQIAEALGRMILAVDERGGAMSEISYDEHRRFLERQLRAAEAELTGFRQAKIGGKIPYSPDPEMQRRYERGWEDGVAKMLQDRTEVAS